METHFVYIAASERLLSWTGEQFGRFTVKVGTSYDPAVRESFLKGENPLSGGHVPACCGCTDWKVVTSVAVQSDKAADSLQDRFKASFDAFDAHDRHAPPWRLPQRSNGESDLVLLPADFLQGTQLHSLDPDVRQLYFAARSRLYYAIRVADEQPEDGYDDPEERQLIKDREQYARDQADDLRENQDRAAYARENGHYYED